MNCDDVPRGSLISGPSVTRRCPGHARPPCCRQLTSAHYFDCWRECTTRPCLYTTWSRTHGHAAARLVSRVFCGQSVTLFDHAACCMFCAASVMRTACFGKWQLQAFPRSSAVAVNAHLPRRSACNMQTNTMNFDRHHCRSWHCMPAFRHSICG
jgi:hypothetical protein